MPTAAGENSETHDRVAFHADPAAGLRVATAVHRRVAAACVVCCRMHPYPSDELATADALRLSRGISLSCAFAGLPYGGAALVVRGDPRRQKTAALMAAIRRRLSEFRDDDPVLEDIGMAPADVLALRPAIAAATRPLDPSMMTARGLLRGIEAALARVRGTTDLHGCRVAVQGLGRVGMALADCLHDAGAELIVADLSPAKVALAEKWYRARGVSPDIVHTAAVDVFAPCAVGGTLTASTIPELRSRIIAGSAGDQLAEPSLRHALADRGVLMTPDFVVNAGGLITLHGTTRGDAPDAVRARVDAIHAALLDVFESAARKGLPPLDVAEARARRNDDPVPPRRAA